MTKIIFAIVALLLFAFGVFLVIDTKYEAGGVIAFGLMSVTLYREFVSFIDTL